jgi:anaerobic magnesium-protoporphyrin IX monomethyl ester cyclase
MADVLLGQAYYLRFDDKLWRAQQPYAPLGTLYAASCLRQAGHAVSLFDAMLARSEAEWAAAIDRARPAVAVIYEDSFNYLSKMCLLRMRTAALRMIDLARARGCTVVVSGSDATDHPDIYLAQGAEVVILGEGEVTLTDVVGRLRDGSGQGGRARRGAPAVDDPASIAGIAYVDADGCVQRTAARPFVRALDALPFPAWDLIDVDRYRGIWRHRHGYHSMNVVTTRGCPYHCNWCAKPIYGQRYGVRSVANVVDELDWLRRDFHPDHIWFMDDVFGLVPGWTEAFAADVQRRGLRLPFRCLMRADQVREPVVAALAAASCRMVWMGAESGSQRILDAMEKGQTVDDVRRATRRLRAGGIQVGFFLQFGYPGEGRDDIEATLDLVRELDPDDIGVSVSYPLPGTRFYDRVHSQLGVKRNWVDSNDLALMYRGAFSQQFYRVLHRVVHHEFRARRRPSSLRTLASWAYNAGALSFRRWQLNTLAARPAAPPTALEPALSPAAAAIPTRQDE